MCFIELYSPPLLSISFFSSLTIALLILIEKFISFDCVGWFSITELNYYLSVVLFSSTLITNLKQLKFITNQTLYTFCYIKSLHQI